MATVQYEKVKCDKCNHKFRLKSKIIKRANVIKDIEKHYFLCPKCKHQYVIVYKNQEFKENLKQIEIIESQASKLEIDSENYRVLLNRYEKLYKRNLEISKTYKFIYGS